VRFLKREKLKLVTCPKRELKCVRVLKREMDSVTCHKKCKQKDAASLEKNEKFKELDIYTCRMGDIIQIRYICLWIICGIYNKEI